MVVALDAPWRSTTSVEKMEEQEQQLLSTLRIFRNPYFGKARTAHLRSMQHCPLREDERSASWKLCTTFQLNILSSILSTRWQDALAGLCLHSYN